MTHNFYRYPARFSPKLVRAAIDAFTEPGDLVLDPFVGGGTTLVEAMVSGRHAIGTDISSLATFVSEVKTTIYCEDDLAKLQRWCEGIGDGINIWEPVEIDAHYEEAGYTKHLDSAANWRLKKAIEQVLNTARKLKPKRLEDFARCVLLRTSQWALNGRKKLPSIDDFRAMLVTDATAMIEGARELRQTILDAGLGSSDIRCLNRTTKGLESDATFADGRRPRLVVTSPPYPGVHVLYHRWQVDGRKETPAPFWIANRLDGDGAAYYTMGARTKELNSYFANLRASLQSVAALCDGDTVVVQVVAFAQPEWQLPRYLSVADDVGLDECLLPNGTYTPDGRLWRTVPNRRWYADQRGTTNGSQEVVLFHRRRA
ncbi:MAG: site-specific DNA-methyltransferase [Ideonella sp. WA131b]|nr:site-specific DNA-methyltransferase [Ideonella sp. WA131b]